MGLFLAIKNIYCMPVIVDMSLEMTDADLGPFGIVPLAGRTALQELLLCLYLAQETCTARENRALTKVSPKSTASLPQAGSMTLYIQDLYLS